MKKIMIMITLLVAVACNYTPSIINTQPVPVKTIQFAGYTYKCVYEGEFHSTYELVNEITSLAEMNAFNEALSDLYYEWEDSEDYWTGAGVHFNVMMDKYNMSYTVMASIGYVVCDYVTSTHKIMVVTYDQYNAWEEYKEKMYQERQDRADEIKNLIK